MNSTIVEVLLRIMGDENDIKEINRELGIMPARNFNKGDCKYNLDFSTDIVIYIENQSPPAIYLESPIIKFAANLGARFDMDTYVH